MTHYWWMHWFWITCWIGYVIYCEAALTTIHSNVTELPAVSLSNETIRSTKAIIEGTVYIPPITVKPSVSNISHVKSHKPSGKKFEFHFPNSTTTTSKMHVINKEMTVIKQNNVTDVSVNATDNPTPINTTDNLTYLDEEDVVNFNQSVVQNSERIGGALGDNLEVEVSGNLSAAGITGITLGCVVVVGILCGISYFLYRNRGFNRPQVLNDRCSNPDSSGYIDDASVRDNSEEMYSLDNDSFLNSLEAMTIQNYWTDTVKHTKL